MIVLSHLDRPSVLPFLGLLDPSFLFYQLGPPYLFSNHSRALLLSILAALAVVISLDNQVKDQYNCAFLLTD